MKKTVNIIQIILGIICLIYYIICRLSIDSYVSIIDVWLIMGVVFIVKAVLCRFIRDRAEPVWKIYDIVFAVLLCGGITYCTAAVCAMKPDDDYSCDYIIILGAAVNYDTPSDALQSRIDAAYRYMSVNSKTRAVCTDGMSSEDIISEGQCIADALVAMGIDRSRLIIEEKSGRTSQNIQNSVPLIDKSADKTGIVTSNFHILRSCLIMKKASGAECVGIAADFSGLLMPHYLLREYLSFVVDCVLGNII